MLGLDESLQAELKDKLPRLLPYQIGARGQLQEWMYDFKEWEPKHRHFSHLYGLHPGNQITADGTPDLFDACLLYTSSKKLDILFLGNSITQGFGGNRQLVTYKPGKAAADSCFKNMQWESAGISGDRTETLLWRVQNGVYGKAKPRFVVVTIGVNNVIAGHKASDIAAGIRKVDVYKRQPCSHEPRWISCV